MPVRGELGLAETGDVLQHDRAGLDDPGQLDCPGEQVTLVIGPLLPASHAEGLAGNAPGKQVDPLVGSGIPGDRS